MSHIINNERNVIMVHHWINVLLLCLSLLVPKSSCSKSSPLYWYSVQQGHGCPLFPCAESQSDLMSRDYKAIQLLDTLELPYQEFNGSVLPIIPDSSTAAQLYTRAQQLKSAETGNPSLIGYNFTMQMLNPYCVCVYTNIIYITVLTNKHARTPTHHALSFADGSQKYLTRLLL